MSKQFQFSASNLNYDDIQSELKNYFETLGYEFVEGGNYSNLIKVLSYISLLNGQYLSNTINNLFISSANSKEAIYLLARQVGYVPRRRVPSRTRVVSYFTPTSFSGNDFTVSSVSFSGKNNTYSYNATNVEFIKQLDGRYKADFIAEEKATASYEYYGDNTINQDITLPETNISKDDITAQSVVNGVIYNWTLINSFQEFPDENARIFFIEVNTLNEVKLVFGNNVYGMTPSNNEKISFSYYVTNGADGNDETDFDVVSLLSSEGSNFNNISKYEFSFSQSYGGSDFETIEEIQKIAPKFFSSLGNHIVQKDFETLTEIANDYTAYASTDTVNYTGNNITGKTYLSLVPSSYRTEDFAAKEAANYPNGSFPSSEITQLAVSDDTYDTVSAYFNGWTYIDIISPTYLYVDITPHIEIQEGKNFSNIAYQVFEDLLEYVEDENYITNIFGFSKKFRDSQFYKLMLANDNVVSAELEAEISLLVNKDNILDKYFLKMPNNFLQSNKTHLSNLQAHNNYQYEELLVEDSTIFCEVEDSEYAGTTNQFKRYLVSSDTMINEDSSKLFELTFIDDEITSKNVLSVYINGKLVTCNIVKYNDANFPRNIPLIYSQENLSTVTSNYNYNYSRTEDTWFLYLNNSGINYLVGEIIKFTSANIYYVFKEVDNRYAIQKMFEVIGLTQYSTTDFLTYDTSKVLFTEDSMIVDKYNLAGYISFSSSENTVENTSNLKITSRKKIATIELTNTDPIVTIDDSTVFSHDSTAFGSSQIKIYDNVNKDDSNAVNVLTLSYDNYNLYLTSTLSYSSNDSTFAYYKDNKFKIVANAGKYEIYCYEIYDDISLATIGVENGMVQFNRNVVYYPDYKSNAFEVSSLENIFYEVFNVSENTIYKLKLISQNQIGSLLNTNESFDTDGTQFLVPNLNHIQEI